MHTRPMVLVQPPVNGSDESEGALITVIVVYSGEAPISVTTQRVFDGESRFGFPSEITRGATKTRIVYSYTPLQWAELLEACTLHGTQGGIKQIMIPLLRYFQEVYPGRFGGIQYDSGFDPEHYAEIVKLR
ncbi:MAG: hypothetical protein ACOY4I_13995 [Bacillota bacterium]